MANMALNSMKTRIKRIFNPVLILFLVLVFLAISNIRPNTYLLGWDNQQVEFDPILNLTRNFSSVWEEYQGLGLVAGHGHSTEVVRIILFSPLLLLPQWLYRYVFQFILLAIGVYSTYFLSKLAIFEKYKHSSLVSFIVALFYMLNLGTVQNFYSPLEAFSAFYAFLPLSILIFYLYVYKGFGFKNGLMLTALLAITTAFFIPTLFFVFCLLFLPLNLGIFIKSLITKNFILIKRQVVFWMVFFFINLYWLAPFGYYLFSGGVDSRFDSIINRISSENAYQYNNRYGNISDVSKLRGFWFSYIDYYPNNEGQFEYMLQPWIGWISYNFIAFIGYFLFLIIIIGVIFATFSHRRLFILGLLCMFFLSLFFLIGTAWPTGFLYSFIVDKFPVFGEVFRFAFTKWIVPASLTYSIFLGFGFVFFAKTFEKFKNNSYVLAAIIISAILLQSYPIFRGNFIYENLKIELPNEYKQLFAYFKSQDISKRIVNLPQHTFWGWRFHNWGYRGSGFMWYGIEQAITDRAFDGWNYKNEQFYNELQYAIYSQNIDLFDSVLNKYQIDYLLIDESVITPDAKRALFYEATKELLSRSNRISLDTKFGDFIFIYKVDHKEPSISYVYTPKESSNILTRYNFSNLDPIYLSGFSNYILVDSINDKKPLHFPFSDDRVLASLEDYLIDYPSFASNDIYSVVAPGFDFNSPLPALVSFNSDNIEVSYLRPKIVDSKNNDIYENQFNEVIDVILDPSKKILFNNKPVKLTETGSSFLIKPNSTIVSYDSFSSDFYDFSDQIYSSEVNNCSGSLENVAKSYDKYPGSVIVSSDGGSVCLDFDERIENTTDFVYEISYLYKNVSDSKQTYCLYSENEKKCLNEKYNGTISIDGQFKKSIDYVIAKGQDKLRFSLISDQFNSTKSEEVTFKDIKVYRYPLTQIKIFSPSELAYSSSQKIIVTKEQLPLKVILPEYRNLSKLYIPGDFGYNIEAKNCDNFNEKKFARDLGLFDDRPLYKYSAIDAISCDNLETTVINANSDYLITFDSKNIIGKNLDICIAGIDLDKCLIQERLNGNGRESFILPSYPSAESVGINIGNQSIGNAPTENELYGVDVKYFPYKWLKGIYVKPKNAPEFYENGVKLLNVDKKAIYKYEVKVEKSEKADVKEGGLIILNQSFENGWGLYEKDSCLLGMTTPFTCKKSTASHVLAKNWANSWIVPGVSASYVIIFWPQYLQFLGYLVFIVFIFVIGFSLYYKKAKTASRA